MNLRDAVAVITGGGSGLGEATAREFAGAGAKIVILDLPNSPGAKVAETFGGKGLFLAADVVTGGEIDGAIAKATEHFGTVHIAVNCTGIGRAQRTVSKDGAHSLDLFNKVVQVNLVGTFNVIRLAARQMTKNSPNADGERGVIINTRFNRGVRRSNRSSRLRGIEGRRRRPDAAGRARPRGVRYSRLYDRARDLRHADARVAAGSGAQGAGSADSVSVAARPAIGIRRARTAYRRERNVERRNHPPRWRAPR